VSALFTGAAVNWLAYIAFAGLSARVGPKPHYKLRVWTVGRTERRLVWRCELMNGQAVGVNSWDWWTSSRAAIDAAGGRVFDAKVGSTVDIRLTI
jgi:hypothetical protein